ncbi:MAG: BlaI/MecI/CopY family transcriptional regulator [Gemmatimonadota bacterium]
MTVFTDRELDIMTVLWQHGSATAAEVRDALERDGIELAYNTVQTILRILQDKGHVGYTVEGRAHRFHPLVQREEASRSAVRRLLDGLFDRSPELLLSHLVRAEALDRATLERMRDLVESELSSTPAAPARSRTSRRKGA